MSNKPYQNLVFVFSGLLVLVILLICFLAYKINENKSIEKPNKTLHIKIGPVNPNQENPGLKIELNKD